MPAKTPLTIHWDSTGWLKEKINSKCNTTVTHLLPPFSFFCLTGCGGKNEYLSTEIVLKGSRNKKSLPAINLSWLCFWNHSHAQMSCTSQTGLSKCPATKSINTTKTKQGCIFFSNILHDESGLRGVRVTREMDHRKWHCFPEEAPAIVTVRDRTLDFILVLWSIGVFLIFLSQKWVNQRTFSKLMMLIQKSLTNGHKPRRKCHPVTRKHSTP